MDHKTTLQRLEATIREDIPGYERGYKDQNWVSKLLGVLAWVFNRRYMTDYTTTRYPRVFFPTLKFVEDSYSRAWKILAHEFVHLWHRKTDGFWHNIRYAFPQALVVLALPSLLAIWFSNWWLLCLIFTLSLLPLPAPGRMKEELAGYTMSLAVNYWRYGSVRQETVDWVAGQFTGSGYYFMWPFKKDIHRRLAEQIELLESGEILEEAPFKRVHDLITS